MMVNSSPIPEIVLDECVYSKKLLNGLRKFGYQVKFLGRGISDNYIRFYVHSHDAVLITEDRQLQASLGWKKSLFLESWNSLKDMILVISTWLRE